MIFSYFWLFVSIIIAISYRLLSIMYQIYTSQNKNAWPKRNEAVSTMICIGSGGHTKEMLLILNRLNFEHFNRRVYVLASSDSTSLNKIYELEKDKSAKDRETVKMEDMENSPNEKRTVPNEICYNSEKSSKLDASPFEILRIPRSREVNQSMITSVFTTLYACIFSMISVAKVNPELVLCNGPGTCVPICLAAILLRVLFWRRNKIVYVESYCRVQTLSLTGKILLFFADNFIVQWEPLKRKYPRTEYFGTLF